MEGDAVSDTVGVRVGVSGDEISLNGGLEKDADKLKGTLATIHTLLDYAHNKFNTDAAGRAWLEELEAVAFDADNVLDELDYRRISKKMNSTTTLKKKVSSYFPSFKQYFHRRQMVNKIKEINMRFESINRNTNAFGLEKRLADAPSAPGIAADETESFTADPICIERDDDVSKIVGMLATPTDRPLSILPMVGMGGLGKTTLARKVFNHDKTKSYFGLQIWVHVSKNFDTVILLKKILASLQGGNVQDENQDVLLKKLREAFGAQTYMAVFDDVWNDDRHKWEDFINLLSEITSTLGNYIIVTTRNTKVGSIVKADGSVTARLEAMGKSIARRGQGLPLAAEVVRGVLCCKSQDEWLSINEYLLSDIGGDENSISLILRLSYDHLFSPSLKKCFAYCSVFPKGTHMKRTELLQLWMAEGFFQPSMEDTGNKFVNLLVQNSLLQVVDRDKFNNVKHCSMHDLVHDVAVSVNNNTPDGIDAARYFCWQSHGDEANRIQKEQARWLRALFYEGEISEIMFSDFRSLHALTLRDDDAKELPDSIGELIHLRYLNITRTSIQKLPDSIGELHHLQTFKARNRSLKKLPETFNRLFNLMHLHLLDNAELPPQLGRLTSLWTLPFFKVCDGKGHRIEELKSLYNLKGKLKIDNLEKVDGEEDSRKAYLSNKPGIVRLVLRWNESRDDEINDESVLKGLKPHLNLQTLEIFGFQGANFPSWTLKMEGFDNMMEIRLERCEECEEIPTLGHLPILKSLFLSGLRNVKSIGPSFYGDFKETNTVFQALERLELKDMPSLTEWVEVEISRSGETDESRQVEVFPCLKYLKIENCERLWNVPSHFPWLRVLKMRRLWEMICLPDMLFHNNHNLSVLEIKDCPKLRELPDGLQTLNSLKELTILACENLKSIPCSSGGQDSTLLRRLSIGSETVINFPRQMVESWASSLEVLQLRGRPIEMQMIIECMHKMSHLKALSMDAVPKFIITSPVEVGALPNLQTFIYCSDGLGSWDCASFNKAADGILRLGCQSLRTIELTGNANWESIPDQLQHLTALSELRLSNFGIEELPEWFGNLSSLSELRLSFCNKLKGLPAVEVMQCLTNLTKLCIFKCPMLKGRCIEQHDDGDGSEWHKISHIPTVQADGQYIRGGGRIPS